MNIAIIPARGGSKRIPRKNIKHFGGKPMIAWAIEVAIKCALFDRVIVSTDDAEIIEISNRWGAETPFTRPNNLADDSTPTVPVIAHGVEQCIKMGWLVNHVCCIYPGVPLLEADDLINAYDLMKNTKADFVYPVSQFAHPIQRGMRRLSNGQMEFIDPANEMTRTQDLEVTFHDAGQFYWGKVEAWLNHKRMHSGGVGMVIPNWRVIDIDDIDDWKRAELMAAALEMTRNDI